MVVSKIPTHVLVYTGTHRLEGMYHRMPESRVLDDLNRQKDFVSLTSVKVSPISDEGSVLFEANFVAVNKSHIVLVCPDPKPPSAAS